MNKKIKNHKNHKCAPACLPPLVVSFKRRLYIMSEDNAPNNAGGDDDGNKAQDHINLRVVSQVGYYFNIVYFLLIRLIFVKKDINVQNSIY